MDHRLRDLLLLPHAWIGADFEFLAINRGWGYYVQHPQCESDLQKQCDWSCPLQDLSPR
jgi:hypothetical protein